MSPAVSPLHSDRHDRCNSHNHIALIRSANDSVAHICSEADLSSGTSTDAMQVLPLMHSRSLGAAKLVYPETMTMLQSSEPLTSGPHSRGGASVLSDQHLLAQRCQSIKNSVTEIFVPEDVGH